MLQPMPQQSKELSVGRRPRRSCDGVYHAVLGLVFVLRRGVSQLDVTLLQPHLRLSELTADHHHLLRCCCGVTGCILHQAFASVSIQRRPQTSR